MMKNYQFDFNGVWIEVEAASRAEAFPKACENYEWLLKLQEAKFEIK